MGKIFYRREDVDFTKFVFDNISEESIIIVPEQFSFYVERQSFEKLNKSAVLGIDIMGFSRLGEKILQRVGINKTKISSEGKNMLITKIAMENKDKFKILGEFSSKSDFPDMMQDTIRQLKQGNFKREDFEVFTAAEQSENSVLKDKLSDVLLVYEKYSEIMDGSYIDAQDFADLYNAHIEEADFLEETDIWIYGFDAFDEKRLQTIQMLNRKAKSLNIVLTYEENNVEPDIFSGIEKSVERLILTLNENGSLSRDDILVRIDDSYILNDRAKDISYLEQNLFSIKEIKKYEKIKEQDCVHIVKSANPYNQAVAAASFINELLRKDESLRLRDIAIISNTIDSEAVMFKSIFDDFGIKLFIDERKSLKGNPIILYLTTLLDVLYKELKTDYVIEHLKIAKANQIDDIENLELYCKTYDIEEEKWLLEFKKGSKEYGKENIDTFNSIRKDTVLPIIELLKVLKDTEKVVAKLNLIKDFIIDEGKILEKIEEILDSKELSPEESLEMKQVSDKIFDVMRQMVKLIGYENFSLPKTIEILKSGITSIDVGIIPPMSDSIIIGDMSRVIKGISKVTLILGMNDGVLPKVDTQTGFITKEDVKKLQEEGFEFFDKIGKISYQQYLNIYRNIATTKDYLYLGYVATDSGGEDLEKSEIIKRIDEFIDIDEKLDPISSEAYMSLIGGKRFASLVLVEEFYKAYTQKREPSEFAKTLYEVISKDENLLDALENIVKTYGYENIEKQLIKKLYIDDGNYLKLSPSRLENFGKCPFAHFMTYGIRPKNIRDYKIEGVDLGSIYHDCIKIFSEHMSKNKMQGWKRDYNKDDIEKIVEDILDEIFPKYREAILMGEGEQAYRRKRIKQVCVDTALSIYEEVSSDNIKTMMFEIAFGKNKKMRELAVDLEDSDFEIGVEGQIDRLDILGEKNSRVIDYKSGKNKFKLEDSLRGISLQLFIYLLASGNLEYENNMLMPSGSFYFPVRDQLTDSQESKEKIDGFWREEIDQSISKEFFTRHKSRVWSKEYFEDTVNRVKEKINEMASDIADGKIDALPKEFNSINSCTYCDFKGICKFDISIDGCKFNKSS